MVDAVGGSVLGEYAISKKNPAEAKPNGELGQKAFLKLMITQMQNQDPLSPQENTEFIAQLAQFSSVESLDQLNNNFNSFTESFVGNQALQASSLVGRSVTVPSEVTRLEPNDVVTAIADLPSYSNNVTLEIYDDSGALRDKVSLGAQSGGELNMRWNGKHLELNGERLNWQSSHAGGLPPGDYRFKVNAQVDGESTALDTYLSANVNSVTVGKSGALTLNLAGIGAVNLADVKQFNE